MKKLIVVGVLLALAVTGCTWFESKPEKSAQALAMDGMEAYKDGRYKKSVESFERIKDWYPFSEYASLAELKIADAHYRMEEYEDAVFAYEEFENLHPRNDAVPYVIYQIGRCYFEQMGTIDRDQSTVRNALMHFQRLSMKFPSDPYAAKARDHIKECLKSLAGHDYYVGEFYFKSKHYKAALSRFKSVLNNYPDVGVHQKALLYIAQCETRIENGENEPEEKGWFKNLFTGK
jgi:outer membrane protein assembly factor BamD